MSTSNDSGCYRITGIGESLTDSLEEFVEAGIFTEDDCAVILAVFDAEMRKMLAGRNTTVNLRGDVRHYKLINNVWDYQMKELKLHTQGRAVRAKGDTKIVFPINR